MHWEQIQSPSNTPLCVKRDTYVQHVRTRVCMCVCACVCVYVCMCVCVCVHEASITPSSSSRTSMWRTQTCSAILSILQAQRYPPGELCNHLINTLDHTLCSQCLHIHVHVFDSLVLAPLRGARAPQSNPNANPQWKRFHYPNSNALTSRNANQVWEVYVPWFPGLLYLLWPTSHTARQCGSTRRTFEEAVSGIFQQSKHFSVKESL